jgi:Zn-dependent protease with chaperone function
MRQRAPVRDDGAARSSVPRGLEGVLAHELTHLINRDVMVTTIASSFGSIAALIVRP